VSINAPPHTLLSDAGQRHTMPADTDQWRVVLRKGVQELARAHATCLTIQDLIACTRAMLVKSLHTLETHSLAESSKSVHTQPLPMVAEISIACARAMPTKAVLCSTACHARLAMSSEPVQTQSFWGPVSSMNPMLDMPRLAELARARACTRNAWPRQVLATRRSYARLA
jgi:hypothetical protein